MPSLKADYVFRFHVIEFCTIAVFLVEYVLRFWSAPEANPGVSDWGQRWRYVGSPSALIDALALIPSASAAVALLVTGDGVSLSFLLAVRLIIRSAKLARYFPGGRRLGLAMRRKGSQLLTTVSGLIFVLVIAASLMFFAESNAQPDTFSSIPAAMWWSCRNADDSGLRRHGADDDNGPAAGRGYRGIGHRIVRPAGGDTERRAAGGGCQ